MVDDEEAVQKRPRISRFDVLPATQDSIPQQGFAFEPFSVPNGFKLAFDSISKQPQLYVSATDPTFQAKLESAMEKNLRYLQKLDELALQAKTLDVPFQTLRDAKSSGKQLKFIKLFNPSRKPLKTGIGIERDNKTTPATSNQTDTRVYVNNLPMDITEEELEILFGPQGKIKKIKMYTDNQGMKKGDALITFLKAESVISSIVRLNGLDIGGGQKIVVERPNYSYSTHAMNDGSNEGHNVDEGKVFFDPETKIIDDSIAETMRRFLPHEFNFVSQPIVFVLNGFPYELSEDEVAAIEAKLLIEAYRFGDAGTLQSLLLTLPSDAISSPLWKQASTAVNAAGLFAITFRNNEAAKSFVQSEALPLITGTDNLALWIPYISTESNDPEHRSHENPYTGGTIQKPPAGELVEAIIPTVEAATTDPSLLEQEAEDVEDFLNSLL